MTSLFHDCAVDESIACGKGYHAAVQPPSIERLAPVMDLRRVGAKVDGKRGDFVDGDEFLGRLRGEQHVALDLFLGHAARLIVSGICFSTSGVHT